jgi:hypothetical protein
MQSGEQKLKRSHRQESELRWNPSARLSVRNTQICCGILQSPPLAILRALAP